MPQPRRRVSCPRTHRAAWRVVSYTGQLVRAEPKGAEPRTLPGGGDAPPRPTHGPTRGRGPTRCFQVAPSSLDTELKNLPMGPPPCAPEVLLRVPGPRAGSGASTGALDCGSGGLGAAVDPVCRQGPSVHLAPQGSPGWEEQCPPAPLPPLPAPAHAGAGVHREASGRRCPALPAAQSGGSQPMCSCNWMKRDGVRGEEGCHGAPRPQCTGSARPEA